MLRLNEVKAGYGRRDVLKGVSLELREKEILAVIGLNGSGKSTLLRTMLGLLPATAGSVTWNGRALKEISADERAALITLLDSKTDVGFPMTVGELLNVHGRARAPSAEIKSAALGATGMNGFENRSLLELSSGESKRAFIAHALALNSKLIMFDEPFAHLDWSHQSDLIDQMRAWRANNNTTFVLAIHELERAVQIADRVAVVHEGKILDVESPEKVFAAGSKVSEVFAFRAAIDENPFDGSRRLTLGRK